MLISCNLIGQLAGWKFWMSHGNVSGRWHLLYKWDIRYNKINKTFFTGWHGRLIVTPRKALSTLAPPRSTMFPRGDNLQCHHVKNVIFIYYSSFWKPGMRPDVQYKSASPVWLTLILSNVYAQQNCKTEKNPIWLSPMTKALRYQQKIQQPTDNTKTPPKISITQRLRTDLGRSVGVTTAIQLMRLNCFIGTKPSN